MKGRISRLFRRLLSNEHDREHLMRILREQSAEGSFVSSRGTTVTITRARRCYDRNGESPSVVTRPR